MIKMRIGIVMLIAFVACVEPCGAQNAAPAAATYDSAVVRRNIVAELLREVRVDGRQRKAIEVLVADCESRQGKLFPVADARAFRQLQSLQTNRDSLIRRLLTSEVDRLQFDRNAARAFPRSARFPEGRD